MSHQRFAARVAGLSLIVVLAASAVSEAQDRQRRGGRGGFFGGRFGGDNVSSLAGREEVQEELKLSDEQKTKIREVLETARSDRRAAAEGFNFREASEEERAAMREKMEQASKKADEQVLAILKEDQQKRVKEIALQQQGIDALRDPEVIKALGIDEEQKAILTGILEKRDEKAQALFASAREGGQEGFREAFQKRRELTEEAEKDAMAVLKDDQKAKFTEMKGKPLELRRGGFGERGRRGRNNDN